MQEQNRRESNGSDIGEIAAIILLLGVFGSGVTPSIPIQTSKQDSYSQSQTAQVHRYQAQISDAVLSEQIINEGLRRTNGVNILTKVLAKEGYPILLGNTNLPHVYVDSKYDRKPALQGKNEDLKLWVSYQTASRILNELNPIEVW